MVRSTKQQDCARGSGAAFNFIFLHVVSRTALYIVKHIWTSGLRLLLLNWRLTVYDLVLFTNLIAHHTHCTELPYAIDQISWYKYTCSILLLHWCRVTQHIVTWEIDLRAYELKEANEEKSRSAV